MIASGGMASAFLAWRSAASLCVLKVANAPTLDEDFRRMFVEEAGLSKLLRHPNIVSFIESGECEGRLFIALEHVDGQPLHRILRAMSFEAFGVGARVRVVADVLEAFEYAHDLRDSAGAPLQLVHRDVTPHNVMVSYDGAVKLLDFGIAKSRVSSETTRSGIIKGKTGYMAPEQTERGVVDRRADLFAVGVILWECVTGRRFVESSDDPDILASRRRGSELRLTGINGVDLELAAICDRALQTEPAARFATAREFCDALQAWLSRHPAPRRSEWSAAIARHFGNDRARIARAVDEARQRLPAEAKSAPTSVHASVARSAPVTARPLAVREPAESGIRAPLALVLVVLAGVAGMLVATAIHAVEEARSAIPSVAPPSPIAAPSVLAAQPETSAPAISLDELPIVPVPRPAPAGVRGGRARPIDTRDPYPR
jgi:serine/threonine-protein kinase